MAKKEPKYKAGDLVWLAEFNNGDFIVPREKVTITTVQSKFTEVMYMGTIANPEMDDDGCREFSEDQIESIVQRGHIFKAIEVRYLGATNTKPARYRARAGGQQVIKTYDFTGGDKEAAEAAQALAEKLGWRGQYFGGQLENGDRVYVVADELDKQVAPVFIVP
jgi:hypothetical protein